MFLNPVTKNKIEICIKSLDSKKLPDIYEMSPKFQKDISETTSQALCELFNKSFSKGAFPDHMKLAMVIPIYRGKSKLEVSNYRPVSVLPILNKVLEKLMSNRLVSFLKKVKLYMNITL